MTAHLQRFCVVRLSEDAIADLHRLGKKDPHIVRTVFKKMLLLERSTNAGEPLLGALLGFRKLIVGDRDWRIVWRVTADTSWGGTGEDREGVASTCWTRSKPHGRVSSCPAVF